MTVNLIEHECCQGTFAFIGMGSILQIDELSDDFDLSGIMLSNERLKASLGSSMPAWCSNNTSYFTIRPQAEEAETVKLLFESVWNLINKETFPDETLNGLVYALIHYYNYLKGMENETSRHEKYATRNCSTPSYALSTHTASTNASSLSMRTRCASRPVTSAPQSNKPVE